MPPGTLHFVITKEDSIVYGEHFFEAGLLHRSLCSHVVTMFGLLLSVSNASHACFLSVLQGFSSWWWAAYMEAKERKVLPEETVGLGTSPSLFCCITP